MKGFFSPSAVATKAQPSLVPRCGACKLHTLCHSPKMKVWGKGKRRIYIQGEAPGSEEDRRNRPFVGDAGQVLRDALSKFDIDLDRDCWTGNSLRCRPPQNATPTKAQISYCRPFTLTDIKELDPDVIILLGGSAVDSFIGNVWKEDPGGIFRWAGFQIPSHKPNAWVCPTFHPSFVMRKKEEPEGEVTQLWFERHLEAAINLKGKPWETPPDYKSQCVVAMEDERAASLIRTMAVSAKAGDYPLAFDYETTTLKPDGPHAEIVSCSVSDGVTSVAYPWTNRTRDVTWELLQSNVPMIASNCKFEERWTKRFMGRGASNWDFDTMLAAHWLDNRSSICSIKFQAYVLLGVPDWASHVEPYLKSPGGNSPNRIRQLDWNTLLTYNAVDSLVEWLVAKKQKEAGRWES